MKSTCVKETSKQVKPYLWPAWLPTKIDSTKILLIIIFLSMVFIPLIQMFAYITPDSIRRVFTASNFGAAVQNSLVSSAVATIITVVLAFLLAIGTERTNIRFKNLFAILFLIPMLVPSISHGMGLVILYGNNGIITRFLGKNLSIYGMDGIVAGSVLYAFPVAYLMLADVIRYEDSSPYEAASVLGLSKWRQFTAISFPYLRKPLISVVFSIFTLIITDYGVPLMVGGKYTTIPMVMYQEVIGQLDFGKGAVYGGMLLLPAVVAFVVDLFNRDRGNSAFVIRPHTKSNASIAKLLTYTGCIALLAYMLLPVVSFVVLGFSADYPNNLSLSLANIGKAFELRAGSYLVNSIIIAACVSVVGVCVSFLTAYLSARIKSKVSRFLHLSSMTSAAIPGIVLGLSYVLTFKGLPIYGTIVLLVMVNLVHFIASPYLMIYNSLCKINENLESVALTLGITRLRMIKDVFIPQCKVTLFEMFDYFFVNCMVTISAVSFLANTRIKPISLMINQFEAQMQLECAAIVSLMIFGVNLLVKGGIFLVKSRFSK